MPAHEQDLDADFLAIYGIDLERDEISGPRYFALAHRLTAYTGVMAARVQEDEDEQPPMPPAAPQDSPAAPAGDQQEISLTAFRVQFPGLVSVAQTEGG